MDSALLDDIISRLLDFRNPRPGSARQVQLSESDIRQLCTASKEVFLQQPNLLELEAPIKICGISLYFLFVFCFFHSFFCMPNLVKLFVFRICCCS